MPSFTERYHELTKYRPETIDKLGDVRWDEQPEPFKDVPPGRKFDLIPHLRPLFGGVQEPPDPEEPWLKEEALPALARLLYFTMGITARVMGGGGDHFLRAAPSAGGLYPTEIYVALRDYPDLPSGLYHYHALKAALIPVWEGDFSADLRHHFLDHPAARSRCLVLFTGIYARSAWRYKERAYRRILLDTGHAAANLLEMAWALGVSAAPLASFYDEGLEELFFLARKEEFPLLGMALGPEAGGASGGQRPSAPPPEAARRADAADPLQVQQNACERLYPDSPVRPAPEMPPPFPSFDAAGFNPQSVVLHRRSTRKFNGGSVLRKDAEDMLRFALRETRPDWRLAPGRLELRLAVFAVEGLEPGIYRLDTPDRDSAWPSWKLERRGDFRSESRAFGLGQDLAADAAFALYYAVDMPRLVEAYGDRGYRYACLDAGQIGQRIQLWAVHRELGSSGIGGYYDDLGNEFLGLPAHYGILYMTVAGVPEE